MKKKTKINNIGDMVQIKKGMPRWGEVGTLVKFEYLPVPEIWAWLIEFDNGEKGYYGLDKFFPKN